MDSFDKYLRTPQVEIPALMVEEPMGVEDQSDRLFFRSSPRAFFAPLQTPNSHAGMSPCGILSAKSLPPSRPLTLPSGRIISSIVKFEDYGDDAQEKTPQKKSVRLEIPQTTAHKKYELRTNTLYLGPSDKQESEWTLRILAREALDVVERVGPSSYRQVSERIVEERTFKTGQVHVDFGLSQSKEEKNIKRRVYDALNVMIAIEKLHKRNKKIVADELHMQQQKKKKEKIRQFRQKIIKKSQELKHKKFILKTLRQQQNAIRRLALRNSQGQDPFSDEKIFFPFFAIPNPSDIQAEDQANSKFLLRFPEDKADKEVLGDMQIISKLLL